VKTFISGATITNGHSSASRWLLFIRVKIRVKC